MKYSEIYKVQKKIDDLFKEAKNLPSDPEILSHWAKYLCVLISGFLETGIAAIYVQYAQDRSHKNVTNYVTSELDFFMNPSMEKILVLAGSFDKGWRKELENLVEGEMKEAIDSISSNRNQIAHGEDIGLTLGTISRYYVQARKLVKAIDEQCNR
jgi:hypothetical protein